MKDRDLVDFMSHKIKPIIVRNYAKSRGWEEVGGHGKRIWIFNHPTTEYRQLIIPMDQDANYSEALYEIALRLSDIEQRQLDIIISDSSCSKF